MAEILSISMPEELYNRLQGVKKRLNVSRICQQALETAITIEEIDAKEEPTMEELIEKLKAQKQELEKHWRDEGKKQGKEDATSGYLEYADFLTLTSFGDWSDLEMEEKPNGLAGGIDGPIGDWFDRYYEQVYENITGYNEDDLDATPRNPCFDEWEWEMGYVEGVWEVWKKLPL